MLHKRGREAAVAGLVERDAGQAEVEFGPRRELSGEGAGAELGRWRQAGVGACALAGLRAR